jgi:hypothetical protein
MTSIVLDVHKVIDEKLDLLLNIRTLEIVHNESALRHGDQQAVLA